MSILICKIIVKTLRFGDLWSGDVNYLAAFKPEKTLIYFPLLPRFSDNSCKLEFSFKDWRKIPAHCLFSWSRSLQVILGRLDAVCPKLSLTRSTSLKKKMRFQNVVLAHAEHLVPKNWPCDCWEVGGVSTLKRTIINFVTKVWKMI